MEKCGRNNIQNVSFLWSTEESKSNGFGTWLNDDRIIIIIIPLNWTVNTFQFFRTFYILLTFVSSYGWHIVVAACEITNVCMRELSDL